MNRNLEKLKNLFKCYSFILYMTTNAHHLLISHSSNKTDSSNKLHLLLEDKIFCIFFNISRIDSSNISHKSSLIFDFLHTASHFKNDFPIVFKYFLDLYKKIILYVRDIYYGLGERSYSYLLLSCMHSVFPQYTPFILKSFFFNNSHLNNILPIGSWCDLKYLPSFILSHNILSSSQKDMLFFHIIHFVNLQLFTDISNARAFNPLSTHPRYVFSNVSKWIPREKKNSILIDFFYKLAFHWSNFYDTSPGHIFKKYRSVIADLNNIILTYETHSDPSYPSTLNHQFNNLVFSNPCILSKPAFFSSSSTSIKPGLFISHMFSAINSNDKSRIHFLNFRWSSFIHSHLKFPSFHIPIIDMTLYHHHIPSFYDMLGLAIYIAFNSSYDKKILIASHKPIWLDLSNFSYDLHSIVAHFISIIRKSNSIFSTDINSSLTLIQDSLLSTPSIHSHSPNVIIFAYRPSNFLIDFNSFHELPFTITFWNISKHTFDIDFIKSIKYKFFFLNSLTVNPLFFSQHTFPFIPTNAFDYFNFLFSNSRYHIQF